MRITLDRFTRPHPNAVRLSLTLGALVLIDAIVLAAMLPAAARHAREVVLGYVDDVDVDEVPVDDIAAEHAHPGDNTGAAGPEAREDEV